MNYIVVNETTDGEACMNYLRANSIGNATFIVLSEMKRVTDKRKAPYQVPDPQARRLFDLIEPKKDLYLDCFYKVLQNTLVAPDVKEASRIAYGQ